MIDVWVTGFTVRLSSFSLMANGIEAIRASQGATDVSIGGTAAGEVIDLRGISLVGISNFRGDGGDDTLYGGDGD